MTDEKVKEPETKQATPEMEEETRKREAVMAGFQVQLNEDGVVRHKFFGDFQNITIYYGLLATMKEQVDALQTLQPGMPMDRTAVATTKTLQTLGHMANALIGIQSNSEQLTEMLKAIADELKIGEKSVDAAEPK